jgi:hypothetical protein
MNDYLGYIVWHSLPSDAQFDLNVLTELVEEENIPLQVPSTPTKANLFKRGCKNATFKYDEEHAKVSVTKRKVYVRPSKETNEFIERKIARHRVNKSSGLNIEEDIGTLTFDKRTGTYEYSDEELTEDFVRVMAIIDGELNSNNLIDHLAMRNIVRTFLEDQLNALWLRSGTYFIEKEDLPLAKDLEDVCIVLGQSDLRIIPLVNTLDQQDLVAKAFQIEINKKLSEFDELLASLKASDKQPTSPQISNLETLIKGMKYLECRASSLLDMVIVVEQSYMATISYETYTNSLKEKYGK